MTRALLELLLRSARGRLRRWLRMLKQPRYAVGLLAGIAYFVFLIGPSFVATLFGGGSALGSALDRYGSTVLLVLSAQAAAGVGFAWLLLPGRAALKLGAAEIHVLGQAPIARRRILQYALLKSQPGILLAVALFTALRAAGIVASGLPGGVAGHALTLWLLLTLIDAHVKALRLFKSRTRELARGTERLVRIVIVVVVGLAGLAVTARVVQVVIPLAVAAVQAEALEGVRLAVERAVAEDWSGRVLAPARWALAPLFASDAIELLRGWGLLAVLVLVHHEWLVRSQASFEEASIAREQRARARGNPRLAMIQGQGARARRRVPFDLGPTGAPWVALYWKSLLGHSRRRLALRLGGIVAFALALAAINVAVGVPAPLLAIEAGIGASLLAFVPFGGGPTAAVDLRTDLQHFELVRAWPVSGARLLWADILAPTTSALVVAALGGAVVVACDVSLRIAAWRGAVLDDASAAVLSATIDLAGGLPAWTTVPVGALAAVLVAAATGLLAAAFLNVLVLWLPSWFAPMARRRQGVAAMGHFALIGIFMILVMGLALLPVVGLAAAMLVALTAVSGTFAAWHALVVASVAALALVGETALVIGLAGRRWDRIDPSDEMLEAA